MEKNYIEDQAFEKIDFTSKPLAKADYENCTFINCDFSNTELSGINFTECTFNGCNMSMVKLIKTSFRDAQFSHCKLPGLHFEQCDQFLFAAGFDNCLLHLSSFYQMKIKKMHFKNCNLHEADFTGADLSQAVFTNCDLAKALFGNTVLGKADLRSSYNYSIDPELNKVKKAKFSTAGLAGLLGKYDIEIE